MQSKRLSNSIVFNSINVNTIGTLSGIFVGTNSQWFWKSHDKSNTGFGSMQGESNLIQNPLNIVIDPDVIDNAVMVSRENSF